VNATIIEDILNYFKNLVAQHSKLNGFYIGSLADMNDNNKDYPLVFAELPVKIESVNGNPNNSNGGDFEEFNIILVLSCWTKIYEDGDGNNTTIINDLTDNLSNLLDTNFVPLNPILMGRTHQYLSHLISKLISDSDNNLTRFQYINSSFQTKLNAYDDNVVGTEVRLVIKCPNPYSCEFAQYFTNKQ
jgi:hypothetical protein